MHKTQSKETLKKPLKTLWIRSERRESWSSTPKDKFNLWISARSLAPARKKNCWIRPLWMLRKEKTKKRTLSSKRSRRTKMKRTKKDKMAVETHSKSQGQWKSNWIRSVTKERTKNTSERNSTRMASNQAPLPQCSSSCPRKDWPKNKSRIIFPKPSRTSVQKSCKKWGAKSAFCKTKRLERAWQALFSIWERIRWWAGKRKWEEPGTRPQPWSMTRTTGSN